MYQLAIAFDTAGLVQTYTVKDLTELPTLKQAITDNLTWTTVKLGSTTVLINVAKIVSISVVDFDAPEQFEIAKWSYSREKQFETLRKQAELPVGFMQGAI